MDWIVYPARDFLVWVFENSLEPLGNLPNIIFSLIFFFGAAYWLFSQNKLNKKAEADPSQIK